MLQRSKDADHLNEVLNHPEVSRWMLGLPPPYDCSQLLANSDNVYLANEHGGFLFLKQDDYVYEVHTQFLPEGRGNSLRLARDAAFWMFTRSDALAITTYVPTDNPAALALTNAMGFLTCQDHKEFNGRTCTVHLLTIKDWARSLCQRQSH